MPDRDERSSGSSDVLLLDQQLEDRFFRALLEYPKLVAAVRDALAPDNFSTQLKARLFKTIVWHWGEFSTVPGDDVLRLEMAEFYNPTVAELGARYVARVRQIQVPEWAWIASKVDQWVKTIRLHKALFEGAKILRGGDLGGAQRRVLEAVRSVGVLDDPTRNDIRMTPDEILDVVEEKNLFCCPTRVYALDAIIRGLYRKELFVIMSPLNVGKSWAAVHVGVSGLMTGKGVLHLSGEMGKEKIMARYMQNVSGLIQPRGELDYEREVQVWDEAFVEKEARRVRTLLDVRKVSYHLNVLTKFGGQLSLRHYSSGSMKLSDIDREIMLFDVAFGKLPDLLIVDGLPDIDLGIGGDDRRLRLGLAAAARDIRRMANEYNLAACATHQGNRSSLTADVVGAEHTGVALAVMQVADTAVSLNQTRAENELGMMRMFLMRVRNQKKWALIEMWQNLDIGQFCQGSRIAPLEEEEPPPEEPKRGRGGSAGGGGRKRGGGRRGRGEDQEES